MLTSKLLLALDRADFGEVTVFFNLIICHKECDVIFQNSTLSRATKLVKQNEEDKLFKFIVFVQKKKKFDMLKKFLKYMSS